MDLSGKKAVVFGGTSGIGLATSLLLARDGAEVMALSRKPDKVEGLPNGVTTRACDVRDHKAVEAILNELSPIDILVTTATGGKRAYGRGYANVVRFGAKNVSDGGSITLVSGAPARNCQPGQVALSSVGGAVEAMMRAVAREVAPRIRINAVSPGTIDTPMVLVQGTERQELYRKTTKNNLIPRAGTADEVAQGIIFVIKNKFVTGTTVDVDGGWLLREP